MLCQLLLSTNKYGQHLSGKHLFDVGLPQRPLHAQRLCGVCWLDRRSGVSQELKTSSACFSASGFSLTSRPAGGEARLRLVYAGTPPEMEMDNRVSPRWQRCICGSRQRAYARQPTWFQRSLNPRWPHAFNTVCMVKK